MSYSLVSACLYFFGFSLSYRNVQDPMASHGTDHTHYFIWDRRQKTHTQVLQRVERKAETKAESAKRQNEESVIQERTGERLNIWMTMAFGSLQCREHAECTQCIWTSSKCIPQKLSQNIVMHASTVISHFSQFRLQLSFFFFFISCSSRPMHPQ